MFHLKRGSIQVTILPSKLIRIGIIFKILLSIWDKNKLTLRNPTNKNVLKLIGTNDRVVIQNRSWSDVPVQNIISDIKKRLLSWLVLIHVEGIVDFCRKYPLTPDLYRVDWWIQVFHLRLFQHSLFTDFVQSQTVTHSSKHLLFPRLKDHRNTFDLGWVLELKLRSLPVPLINFYARVFNLKVGMVGQILNNTNYGVVYLFLVLFDDIAMANRYTQLILLEFYLCHYFVLFGVVKCYLTFPLLFTILNNWVITLIYCN